MSDTPTPKVRFKLPGGEEFEAEGSAEFIEAQRDYFLQLLHRQPLSGAASTHEKLPFPRPLQEDKAVSGTLTPYATVTSLQTDSNPLTGVFSSALRLWEQLLAQEGDFVYLRHKLHLQAEEAALILLAGGKELLHKESCTALWLARALEKSGLTIGRLDRLLATPIKLGFIQSQGRKRSRSYTLTAPGLARAFVLAEKKALS